MKVQTAAPESGTSWPLYLGVGGLSHAASLADPADHSGSRARGALMEWSGATPDQAMLEARAGSFPFAAIIPHYQAVGRLRVAPEFLGDLRNVRGLLGDSTPGWLLSAWLISATDQEDGDYESFLGEELLDRAVAASGQGLDAAVDTLIAALLADLADYEAVVLTAAPPTQQQRARTVAVTQALARLPSLAPRAERSLAGLAGLHAALSSQLTDGALAEVARDAAASVLAAAAAPVRQVVAVTMLPITPLHDEYMFLRSVQVFEMLYWQVVRCLRRAVTALLGGDPAAACEELADAASRLEATPVLYRVLTTMPREAFAVIRGLTDGRSAIQSRPYRLVELISAPQVLSAELRDKIPDLEVPCPTLQEVFEKLPGHLSRASARQVAEAMARLDTAWRAMKRTHWGITLKIIGDVPGTGGTTGVHYLAAAARIPLFPLLTETGGSADDKR
jgi:tryptophan 2,3-dioxygenase